MDINRLLKKRQLNVQEQIAAIAHSIAKTATFWRDHDIPASLARYAESQGISCSETIILEMGIDFPGMPRLFGLLLTQNEIDTDSTHCEV